MITAARGKNSSIRVSIRPIWPRESANRRRSYGSGSLPESKLAECNARHTSARGPCFFTNDRLSFKSIVIQSECVLGRVSSMLEEFFGKAVTVILFFVGVVLALGLSVILERYKK